MLVAIATKHPKHPSDTPGRYFWGNDSVSGFLREFPEFEPLVKKLQEVKTGFISALFFINYTFKPATVGFELKTPFGSIILSPRKLKRCLKVVRENPDENLQELGFDLVP